MPENPDLVAIYDTHNTFSEGERKIHVLNANTGRCLCGYRPFLCDEIDPAPHFANLAEFLQQPNPDRNICLRCKTTAIKTLAKIK